MEIVKISLTCLRLPTFPFGQLHFNVRLRALRHWLEVFLLLLIILVRILVEAKVKGLVVLVCRDVYLQVEHVVLALVLFDAKLYISYHFFLLVIDLEDFLAQLLVCHRYPNCVCSYIVLLFFDWGSNGRSYKGRTIVRKTRRLFEDLCVICQPLLSREFTIHHINLLNARVLLAYGTLLVLHLIIHSVLHCNNID